MKRIKNMNDFAKEVTLREGGKKNLSIAQVKEVIRHTVELLAENRGASSVWIKYLNLIFNKRTKGKK